MGISAGLDQFLNFLAKYTYTLHPQLGKTLYPRYPFLKEVACSLMNNPRLLIPKSRQMLITWTVCALTLLRALNCRGLHLLLSKNQFSADELLRRICFIFDHLPSRWGLKSETRNQSELKIAGRGRIISLPATEDAPRMHSPTSVFWDEMAFTPFAEKIWVALTPALDNQAYFIGVSTPNGAEGIFAQLVQGAPGNGFSLHPVHWRSHPLRDEKWAGEMKKGLSSTDWRREYEISFEGAHNLVYPEFNDANLLHYEYRYDPSLPVYRSLDFGYRKPFVLWLQETGDGRLIAFAEWAGEDATVEEMMVRIKQMEAEMGIEEARVVFSACDPAGASVDSAGVAPVERLKRAGFKMRYRPSRLLTGIELVKSLLQDASGCRHLFIAPALKQLIGDFRRYRWHQDSQEPLKDGLCDHSMDALRYFAVNYLYAPKSSIMVPKVRGIKSP